VPELPDVAAYLAALAPRIVGARLERMRLSTPLNLERNRSPTFRFLLEAAEGLVVDL